MIDNNVKIYMKITYFKLWFKGGPPSSGTYCLGGGVSSAIFYILLECMYSSRNKCFSDSDSMYTCQ